MAARQLVASFVAALATTLVTTLGLVAPAHAADFYDPPDVLPAADGDPIRSEPSVFHLDPLKLLRAPADVTRIMYASTGATGRIAVTGTVLVPQGAWPGPGDRPVVGYAMGTQGMADRCAPSRQLAAGTEYEGLFVKGLLARGYTVVVTDYEGLGTPGTHAYVNAGSLGRSVLDSVRAAQRLDLVADDAPVLLSGYSEGGNAIGGAVEQLTEHAPELDVIGAYAGAVPADLARVAPRLDGSPYAAFLGYAVAALDASEPQLQIRTLLNERGRALLDGVQETCTGDGVTRYAFQRTADLTVDGSAVTEFLDRPDIAAALERQRLGTRAPTVPTLVAHSPLDDVVDFGQGLDMARSWCAEGGPVAFRGIVTPTHVGAAVAAFPRAFGFFEARVQGVPFTSNCGRF